MLSRLAGCAREPYSPRGSTSRSAAADATEAAAGTASLGGKCQQQLGAKCNSSISKRGKVETGLAARPAAWINGMKLCWASSCSAGPLSGACQTCSNQPPWSFPRLFHPLRAPASLPRSFFKRRGGRGASKERRTDGRLQTQGEGGRRKKEERRRKEECKRKKDDTMKETRIDEDNEALRPS